jgi:YfiH family protein
MSLPIAKFHSLSRVPSVLHFLSTRLGGVSGGHFATLNIAFHVGDQPSNVLENRSRLSNRLMIPLDSFTVGQQVHSGNVTVVGVADAGRGAHSHETAIPETDALVTADNDVCLLVLVADCSPILLLDPERRVIAAIHAGRVGSAKRIVSKTLYTMTQSFGTTPKDVIAAIGPSIDSTNYPISNEKAVDLSQSLLPDSKSLIRLGDTYRFDLARAHFEELCGAGIPPENIESVSLSTFANTDLFFSERRDGKPTGRIGAGIMLRS